jgi:hypothetical protein
MKRTIEICRTTNMGSEKHKTPTGLFFTNWKAEETTSTFDDEGFALELQHRKNRCGMASI